MTGVLLRNALIRAGSLFAFWFLAKPRKEAENLMPRRSITRSIAIMGSWIHLPELFDQNVSMAVFRSPTVANKPRSRESPE